MKHVLVVDDDPIMVSSLTERFRLEDFSAEGTTDIQNTISLIEKEQPDIVILDVYWGNSNKPLGIEVLKKIREKWNNKDLPVLMMSGLSQQPEFDESMDNGANFFIPKPFDGSEMIEKVQRLLEEQHDVGSDELTSWTEHLVGSSPAMIEVARQIRRFAEQRCNVLILGETGTGKDLAARMYYERSKAWCGKNLHIIYLTEKSPSLMERELFGHKKGSFTDAHEDTPGLLEAANHGIVLLNEIGDLPLPQQAKLLNLIENKSITPIGSTRSLKLDVVILAATNRNLKKMIDKGEFRSDLYQRLNVGLIEIPPLRQHLEDIPQLVEYFRTKYNQTATVPISEVEKPVIDYFKTLTWDENVRQLEHCILDAARKRIGSRIILRDVEGFIEREKIRPVGAENIECPDTADFEMDYHAFSEQFLKRSKRDYVEYQLNKHNRHVPTTAKAIGIKRQQLNGMMRALGIRNREK